jgi:hypothetical protein
MRTALLALFAVGVAIAPASADRRRHAKPSAPITLTATAEVTPRGWRVIADVAPHRDVDAIVVEVDGKPTRFAATTARQGRRVVATVDAVPVTGKDVVITVRVAGRSKATIVRVGAPAPAAKPAVITVRSIQGVDVAEVRQ